ncbi:MAG: hypothetical protein QF893_04150 [Alphaproteobacteria bacterium]|nr:hypothetical protein [Alphaproteobacteria bacterium]
MRTELQRGLLRSGIAISFSGAVLAILAAMSDALWDFLKWFEFLSPVPGLSGVTILAVSMVIFLLFVFVIQWVVTGFAEQSEEQRDAKLR